MKLSKIAVLVAFLAAFAIPWLAATAHGGPTAGGSLTIAEQQVVPANPAAPGSESSVKPDTESSPGEIDEDEEDWDYEEPSEDYEQPEQDLTEPGQGMAPQAPGPAGGTH